jgi:hypothetical protein
MDATPENVEKFMHEDYFNVVVFVLTEFMVLDDDVYGSDGSGAEAHSPSST